MQFSSVAQLCLTLCEPMDYSTPGLPVHHQFPEFIQTHVHWVGDAIQLSHLLSSPSSVLNLSQHQGLLQWVSSSLSGGQSIGVSPSTSVLPMNIQGWFPLGLTGVICLQSKGLSRVFSSTTVWKHQFFSTQPSLEEPTGGSDSKESSCNAGDLGLIPGLGRSHGEGKGYPLKYSGLENSMDYIVHGVANSRTWLSDFHIMRKHQMNLIWHTNK